MSVDFENQFDAQYADSFEGPEGVPFGEELDEERERQYSLGALFKYVFLTLGLGALIHFTEGYATPVVAALAFFAMLRRKSIELMYLVMFLTLLGIGNDRILCRTPVAMLTARVTLVLVTFLTAGKIFNSPRTRTMVPVFGIMWFIYWEILSSLQGYAPLVSLLKLVLFLCIFLSMYGITKEVNASTRANALILRSAILSVVAFITIGSVAIIPFPSLSLMTKNDIDAQVAGEAVSLFCGVLSHSQAMGPMAAILGTFIFADLAFSIRKWDWFYLAMLLCCPLIVYKTSSRTALGALLAGWGVVALLIVRSRGIGDRWKRGLITIGVLVVILGGAVGWAMPEIREKVVDFILKRVDIGEKQQTLNMETVMSSRQGLIEDALRGFRQKPMIGNGFQVSAEMEHEHRSGLKDYLAAPIEKGVWFYAIPEEGGIVGMTLFCGWLVYFFWSLYKRKAYVMASTFFVFMVANCGEFSLFSMTYVGGFSWVLVLAAGVLDVARIREQDVLPVFYASEVEIQQRVGAKEWDRLKG